MASPGRKDRPQFDRISQPFSSPPEVDGYMKSCLSRIRTRVSSGQGCPIVRGINQWGPSGLPKNPIADRRLQTARSAIRTYPGKDAILVLLVLDPPLRFLVLSCFSFFSFFCRRHPKLCPRHKVNPSCNCGKTGVLDAQTNLTPQAPPFRSKTPTFRTDCLCLLPPFD